MSTPPEHPPDHLLERYRRRALAPDELLDVGDHIARCARCREHLRASDPPAAPGSPGAAAAREPADDPGHLSGTEFSGYLDGTLDIVQREFVESHVEQCPSCAADMEDIRAFRERVDAAPIVEYAPAARPGFRERLRSWRALPAVWMPLQAAGAAAAVAILYFTTLQPLQLRAAQQRDTLAALRRENTLLKDEARRASTAFQSRASVMQEQVEQARQAAATERRDAERLRAENQRLRRQGTTGRNGPTLVLKDGARRLLQGPGGEFLRVVPASLPPPVVSALNTGKIQPPGPLLALAKTRLVARGEGSDFTLRAPVTTVVMTDRPTLTWTAAPGATAYNVALFDVPSGERRAFQRLTGTGWKLDAPLPRGRDYRWEVLAFKGDQSLGRETAVFRVIEEKQADELARQVRRHQGSPLILGVFYAGAGLLDEAETQFKLLLSANPGSPLARGLLESVQSVRKHTEKNGLPGGPGGRP
jgi:putative zinc finger protein